MSGIDILNQATVASEQNFCYSTGDVCYDGHPKHVPGPEVVVLNTWSIERKFFTDEVHLSYEENDHVNLPCPRLYTLISIFPDETPTRYLIKTRSLVLSNTGFSLNYPKYNSVQSSL